MCLHNCKNCNNFRKAFGVNIEGKRDYEYCFLTQYVIDDWVKKNIYCKDWERRGK